MSEEKKWDQEASIFLVAVDFSHCSRLALRKAKDLQEQGGGRIVAIHVIDHNFVEQCIRDLSNDVLFLAN